MSLHYPCLQYNNLDFTFLTHGEDLYGVPHWSRFLLWEKLDHPRLSISRDIKTKLHYYESAKRTKSYMGRLDDIQTALKPLNKI